MVRKPCLFLQPFSKRKAKIKNVKINTDKMTDKKTLKTLVFSLGLAAMTLTANNLTAQNGGGIFGRGATDSDFATASSEESLMRASEPTYGGITNDSFGETPLGSGIAILLGAGLGYVALKKRKEDEQ